MLIRHTKASDPKSSEITPKSVYLNRRSFLATGAAGAIAGAVPGMAAAAVPTPGQLVEGPGELPTLPDVKIGYRKLGENDELNSYQDISTYNNFYEFGTGKGDPVKYSDTFNPRPWSITVDGLCAKPGTLDLDDFLKPHDLEERIYRLRCVEAWSMVVPWVGVSLADVVKRFEPTGSAKYVQFETIVRPEEMRGQRAFPRILPWPYVEGLRLDEATNPLSILAVGLYGEELPNQNGAPIRLVVPWKYGFKSIKSVVRMTFMEEEPKNSWQVQNAREYGFYANVNPEVDHPRWSQARERRIGELFRRPTLPFNGYGEEVASLYAGMDPKFLF